MRNSNYKKYINRLTCLFSVLLLVNLAGCATGKKKKVGGTMSGGFDDDNGAAEPQNSYSDRGYGSTFVHSLSNNSMTSRVVSRSNADQLSSKLKSSIRGSDAKAKKGLASMISGNRLAGKSLSSVLTLARKIADIELKSGVAKEIPETVKLEIGLTALQTKNFAMFDFMVLPLIRSKNRKIKAAAYNALGVVTLNEGRVPEAVQYFKSSLKAVSNYEAAMLNLGFVSLRYGDTSTANRMITRVKGDWFADTGKLVLSRQSGNKSEVSRLCKKIMAKKAHKPTIFNCGLFEWLANKNTKQAKILINKALKMRGGSPAWDQKGYKTLNAIRGG